MNNDSVFLHDVRSGLTTKAHPQPVAAVVERNQKEQMKKKIERKRTPAVAVQRSVRPRNRIWYDHKFIYIQGKKIKLSKESKKQFQDMFVKYAKEVKISF